MVLTMKTPPFGKEARKGSFPSAKDICGSETESSGPGRFLSRSEDNLDGTGPGGVPGAPRSNPAVSPAPTSQSRPNSNLYPASTPLKETANTVGHGARSSPTERAISKRRAASQQADARISKTKLTVTELQKAKLLLEQQLSDLTRNAESRKAEIAALKMELRKAREEAQAAIAARQGGRQQDAATEVAETGQPGSDVETAPTVAAGEWDRASQSSEVSVACLQDRIVQMEESHYSTSEELQATLQELTDLQDIVNDLSKENAAAAEERGLLIAQMENQGARLDQARLQIQHLKHLLLSGLQRPSGSTHASGDNEDREQQLLQVLKATHEEHEDLKCRYLELRKAHQAAVEEAKERSEMSEMGRDRSRLLELQLSAVEEERGSLAAQLLAAEQRRDAEHREVVRLTAQVEQGRARLDDLQRQMASGNEAEVAALLESSRQEAESELSSLRDALATEQSKVEIAEKALRELQEELCSTDNLNKDLEQRLTDFHKEKIYDRNRITDTEKARAELEDRCRRLAADKAEIKASVLTLQHHLDEMTSERDALRLQLKDMADAKLADEEEWRQFQSDLQTAVVVANDLKLEAQAENERLSDENAGLRKKVAALKEDVDRLRLRSKARSAAVSSSAVPPVTTTSLSVKSLIESLEKSPKGGGAGDSGTVPRLRAPSPVAKLGTRHSVPDPGPLSKSSINLSGTASARPASTTLPSPSPDALLKAATSDTELRRTAPPPTPSGPPPSIPEDTPSGRPKGILLKTPPPPALASRKAYMDPEKKDPLARLMKDAPRGSRRNALLKWSQSRTIGYNNVEITNFSSSWNDGLAFCALLHSYAPAKIPYAQLDAKNKRRNFELAFGVSGELGIPCDLTAGEMVALERPDWATIMAYVTNIYTHFNPEPL